MGMQWLVFVELVVSKEGMDCKGSLVRQVPSGKGLGMEGVGAMVQHLLSIVVGMRGGLDAQVAEHGIGFPSSEELDGVFVDASIEESSGTTRAQGAGTDHEGVDASGGFDFGRRMAKSIRNVARLDVIPPSVVGIVVPVEGSRC